VKYLPTPALFTPAIWCYVTIMQSSLEWTIIPYDTSFLAVNLAANVQREHQERGRHMRVGRTNLQFIQPISSRISDTVQDRIKLLHCVSKKACDAIYL